MIISPHGLVLIFFSGEGGGGGGLKWDYLRVHISKFIL